MSWNKFDGTARNQADTLLRIAALTWTDWHPEGITLHNTAAPTLKQWAESGPAHDARIRNLQSYYENELGWHAGPHFFVSRQWINWFSNPLLPGVHSRCFNATRFGIEMVGDYNAEAFDSGDGAMVRDNAVFLMAALNNKFGFRAEDFAFHIDCKKDNHDCPGKNARNKSDLIARIKAKMAELKGVAPAVEPETGHLGEPLQPVRKVLFRVEGKMSTFGGPDDDGMSDTEGLAVYQGGAQQLIDHLGASFLLPDQHRGLGHRLNPDKFYVACRWPTNQYPFLRDAVAWVGNGKISERAHAVDWGPNANTGRVADLSPGLAAALGLNTDNRCTVTVFEDGK